MRVTETPQFEISITEAPTFILDQDLEPQEVELEPGSQATETPYFSTRMHSSN